VCHPICEALATLVLNSVRRIETTTTYISYCPAREWVRLLSAVVWLLPDVGYCFVSFERFGNGGVELGGLWGSGTLVCISHAKTECGDRNTIPFGSLAMSHYLVTIRVAGNGVPRFFASIV
jgi:hypothetical protein